MQLPTHPYEDSASLAQMHADCLLVESNLSLGRSKMGRSEMGRNEMGRDEMGRGNLESAARRAVEPAPSILFEDFPREITKREIEYSEAAARLANALHLHLD